MSVIGPGSLGALNIAGSVAGSQRNSAADGEIKKNAADRKAQINRDEAAAHSLEDVGETESSPERDADGRLPFGHAAEDESLESNDDSFSEFGSSNDVAKRRTVDAFGERGGVLDLDA